MLKTYKQWKQLGEAWLGQDGDEEEATLDDWKMFKKAADMAGLGLMEWIRVRLLPIARQEIQMGQRQRAT